MKNKRPDLNTLPCPLILTFLIHKRTMWNPSRPPIRLTIETLNHQHLLRRLFINIKPLMSLIRPHTIRLSFPIWIYQLHRHQIIIGHGVRFSDAERVFQDCFDRTPDIDDLEAAFQKRFCFGREVLSYALRARSIRLIDVHSLDWAPESHFLLFILRLGAGIGGCTTDGVVEDVDFGGARTAEVYQFTSAFLP